MENTLCALKTHRRPGDTKLFVARRPAVRERAQRGKVEARRGMNFPQRHRGRGVEDLKLYETLLAEASEFFSTCGPAARIGFRRGSDKLSSGSRSGILDAG